MNTPQNLSYWEYKSYLDDIDYLIVGAGIVGMTAAIELKSQEPDARIVLIDKCSIGGGASSRNAGFACIGSISELMHDEKQYGTDKTLDIISSRLDGLHRLRSLLGDDAISYRDSGGCELFRTAEEYIAAFETIDKWNSAIESITELDKTYSASNCNGLSGVSNQCIVNHSEGLIDTGMMYRQLEAFLTEQDIRIIRGLAVAKYEKGGSGVAVYFEELVKPVLTKNLLICTNAFTAHILYSADVVACRNQVLVTSPVKNDHLTMGYHLDGGYIYFRPVADRVLIGGGRHQHPSENNTSEYALSDDNKGYLSELLRSVVLPNQDFDIDHHWSGILCGGDVRDPVLEEVEPHVYAAYRLGGMGVAIGSAIGRDLAHLAIS
jgi:glycine/D-amino acid oxidase-like deaminating enzyme